jgi:hypothetical protein
MLLAPLIVVLASGASDAAAPARAPAAEAEPAADPEPEDGPSAPLDIDEYERREAAEKAAEEANVLKKKGIPLPPSQERKKYLAWRKKLPKVTQKKIDRFCRRDGAVEFKLVCNGIGPYAIPVPPSLVRMPKRDGDGNVLGLTHEQWQANLTPLQARWYHEECVDNGGEDGNGYSQLCGGTPIVLAFRGERIAYTAAAHGDATDWPTATTPWLARDVDGDGAITSSAELFGSDTVLPDGSHADNGFTALSPLDRNHDGVLDAHDPAFASLVIWADRDGDRQSSPGELTSLASRVVRIALANARIPHCDARGNCEGERSTFTWRDALGATHEGAAIDVYLKFR